MSFDYESLEKTLFGDLGLPTTTNRQETTVNDVVVGPLISQRTGNGELARNTHDEQRREEPLTLPTNNSTSSTQSSDIHNHGSSEFGILNRIENRANDVGHRSSATEYLHALFNEPERLHRRHLRTHPELKHYCSSLVDGGRTDPILKFSEIFAPRQRPFQQRKKQKKETTKKDEMDLCERDQREEFLEPVYYKVFQTTSKKTREFLEKKDETLGHELNSEPSVMHIDETNYENVQQYLWEEEIVWDAKSPQIEPKEKNKERPTSQLIRAGRKRHWGELESKEEQDKTKAEPQKEATLVSVVEQAPVVKEVKEVTTDEFKPVNVQLEEGDWVKNIAWDEESRTTDALVLDLNDNELFPQDPTTYTDSSLFAEETLRSNDKRKEEDDKVDKFNLSNDTNYMISNRNKVRQKLGKTTILHADSALKLSMVKTHLYDEDLANFHQPKLRIVPNEPIRLYPMKKKKKGNAVGSSGVHHESMRHKADLSAKDGRLILMEYVEQYPPVISNVGMGTKLRNYYRKRNSNENPLLRFEDGENVFLEDADESPFLGDIAPGKSVQAIDNNMFRAPIFKHTVPETDFLVIKSGDKAYIREIPAVYTVGQLQPKQEVPAPNSRAANTYIKNRLQAYIYRLLMKKSTMHKLKIGDVTALFPGSSETAIRKRLKDCADFQRGGGDSGWWTVKDQSQLPSEEDLRSMVPPEQVCLYEGMLAGQYHLVQAGVQKFTNIVPAFTAAIAQLEAETDDENKKNAARALEEELLLTPWNLTSNFVAAMQGKGTLQLTGTGDPSGRGEAFSYLRMPQKNNFPKHDKKRDAPKHTVTGTDADLRKLSLENARLVLLKFGVAEDDINKLSRWERIALVRKKSSEAMAAGEGGVTKFARGSRFSLHQQQLHHQEQIQNIWDNQVAALSDANPQFSDEEDEDEGFGTYLENMLSSSRKQKPEAQDEEEEEEYERLKQVIHDDKSSQASSGPVLQYKPAEEGSTGVKYLKKTIMVKNPDGTKSEKVEIIRDPKQVEAYLQHERERQRKEGFMSRRAKTLLSPEEEEEKNKVRREKRRVQEQLRRLRKNKEKQEELKRMIESQSGMPRRKDEDTFRCGACGLAGHMRTNRNCPLYSDNNVLAVQREERSEAQRPVRAESKDNKITLRIPKDALPPEDGELLYLANKGQRVRKRTGSAAARVCFSNTLEKILQRVRSHPKAGPFAKPVQPKEAPGYYDIVKSPISLSDIRDRIRALHHYNNRNEFLADIRLMVDNCHLYNKDRNPHLLPCADEVERYTMSVVQEFDAELADLEEKIKSEPETPTPFSPSVSTPATPFTPLPANPVVTPLSTEDEREDQYDHPESQDDFLNFDSMDTREY